MLPSPTLIKIIGIRTKGNFRNVLGPPPCVQATKKFLFTCSPEKAVAKWGDQMTLPGLQRRDLGTRISRLLGEDFSSMVHVEVTVPGAQILC